MPMYEYVCDCGKRFSKLTRVSDRDQQQCPKCGKAATRALSVFTATSDSAGRSEPQGCGNCGTGRACAFDD